MKNITDYDLYLFDFDGLLVNTEDIHMRAYEEMLKRRGLQLDWDFKTYAEYAHRSSQALADAVYGALPALKEQEPNWETLREEKQKIYGEMIEAGDIELMPGVSAFLESIDKPKIVVTNSTNDQVTTIRHHLPSLGIMDGWFTREMYANPKPAPDGYLAALEKYPGAKAIGFEDTEKGIQSLQSAGIDSLLVRPPHYPEVPLDCPTISTFEEIHQR